MFNHVVLLRFAPDTGQTEIDAIVEALEGLPQQIPALRSYRIGRDLGLAPDNAHLVVQAACDDEAGYVTYRDDPTHRRIIEQQILPILESRAAIQFDD